MTDFDFQLDNFMLYCSSKSRTVRPYIGLDEPSRVSNDSPFRYFLTYVFELGAATDSQFIVQISGIQPIRLLPRYRTVLPLGSDRNIFLQERGRYVLSLS